MSATVKVSKDECFVCHSIERTLEVKIKTPLLHTVVCEKHLYDILKREKTQPKKKRGEVESSETSAESTSAPAVNRQKEGAPPSSGQ
jgi:hypothetical protein